MDYLTSFTNKFHRVFMSSIHVFGSVTARSRAEKADHSTDRTGYPFVFVHGFFGWGQYEKSHKTLPYWGMLTGSLIESINKSGFEASAASVDPAGSAWDRACELYAQIAGTRVDYGRAHSEKYGHPRYGEDYTGRPLVKKWDSENKINIICHSFGGPTCSLLASILENGAPEEAAITTDGTLSEFFKGGKGDYIYSIVGLAATYNGTSLPINHQAIKDTGDYLNSLFSSKLSVVPKPVLGVFNFLPTQFFNMLSKAASGEVADEDTGIYDMSPDKTALLNEKYKPLDNIYYFSVPHDATKLSKDGTHLVPDNSVADYLFTPLIPILGRTDTVTDGGMVLGKEWQPNDGLVNTVSATAPFNAKRKAIDKDPSAELAKEGFEKGVFNVLKTYRGTHMALMGNVLRPDPKALNYLLDLMLMINAL